MIRTCTAMLTMALLASATRAETTICSYAFSKQYAITITDEALKKSPTWKGDTDDPPFPAKKAIKLADEMKDSLVKDTKEYTWKLRGAALTAAGDGKWYWLMTYEAEHRSEKPSGVAPYLRLAVLMDGRIVKPVVKDEPKR